MEGSGDVFAITDTNSVITFLDSLSRRTLGVEADALSGT
jgi:hypothetical protein